MSKLKPCPFCGASGKELIMNDDDSIMVCVTCIKCGTDGPCVHHDSITARKLWNKRSTI